MIALHADDDDAGALAERALSALARSRAISALERAACALQDATASEAGSARSALLQQALLDVGQVSAALVAIDGAALLTQTMTLALQRLGVGADGTLAADASTVPQSVLDLMLALSDYLAQLSFGAPPQLLRLTPYYRSLQQQLGAACMHPADLFFPDLTLAVMIPAALSPAALLAPTLADYLAWRQRFEKALLPFLKGSAGPHAGALRDVIAEVAQVQTDAPAHTFWCALASFADLIASGQLASGQHVKQLFGLINLQLRQLSQPIQSSQVDQSGDGAPHQRMLRDALFFIAVSERASEYVSKQPNEQPNQQPSGQVAVLRFAYRLAGMVPADLEQRDFKPRKARRDASLQVDTPLEMSLEMPLETPTETPLPGARVVLRRVRVDLLERVAMQAAAVAAAHQKLEGEVSALHTGMQDFSSTLGRLRLQLREVEAQAVTQMASQMTVSGSPNFDPLEFDRCTRLQQLVRSMTDSVNQVTVDHQDLIDGAERAAGDVQQQAKLASRLQSDVQTEVQSGLRRLRSGARAIRARAAQNNIGTTGSTGPIGAPSARRVKHRP